jgi:MFS family permease
MNARVVRRLTWLLFFSQSLTSAAFIAGFTVGAIAAAQLSGEPALAGVPAAAYQLGTALAAYPASRFMERVGRRLGLVGGFVIGTTGALICGVAVLLHSFPGFVLGMVGLGVTRGITDLGRYAAAEMHPTEQRGRAISLVVLGGTAGAIGGPALVGPMGRVAEYFQADALAGPWFAAAALLLVGLAIIGVFLRPDPRDIARELAREQAATATAAATAASTRVRPLRAILAQPGTRVAISSMVVGQLVMVMLMSMTSLHMTDHGHPLTDISLVIMAHTLGMFGLSMVTGRLVDNFGRAPIITAGGALLIAACLLAPLSQMTGVLALALFLLGLGWNFCYVGGAALLTDSLTLAERGRMQGGNDLTVGLVSALGSLQSGALFAFLGYANLAWIGLAIALVPALLALRFIVVAGRRVEAAAD